MGEGALLGAGLHAQLCARRAGRVEPPPYDDRRDPETRMLNPHGIARYTPKLADAIGHVLDTGDFPVVLGGDCSIVLGSLLALRRRGRYGLLYVDAHMDFYLSAGGEYTRRGGLVRPGAGDRAGTPHHDDVRGLSAVGAGCRRGRVRVSRRRGGGEVWKRASSARNEGDRSDRGQTFRSRSRRT